jgi:hypothetical protein
MSAVDTDVSWRPIKTNSNIRLCDQISTFRQILSFHRNKTTRSTGSFDFLQNFQLKRSAAGRHGNSGQSQKVRSITVTLPSMGGSDSTATGNLKRTSYVLGQVLKNKTINGWVLWRYRVDGDESMNL